METGCEIQSQKRVSKENILNHVGICSTIYRSLLGFLGILNLQVDPRP